MGYPEMGKDPLYYVNEKGERVRVPEEAELGIGDFFKKLTGVKGNPNRDRGGHFARGSGSDSGSGAGGLKPGDIEKYSKTDPADLSQVSSWPAEPAAPGTPGAGMKGADPFVTTYNGKQVLVETTDGNGLQVSYTDDKLGTKQTTDISIVKGEKNIWAPEVHQINGDWKLFYTSTGSSDNNEDHRMYVLGGSKSPFGPFTTKTQLGASNPKENVWGIDMTPVKIGNKQYVSWSGWDGPHDGFPQNIYMAELKTGKNGQLSTGPRVKISSPSGWEGQIMEGPEFVKDPKGNTVLTYSGNKSWTTDYAMGTMKLKPGADPLKASSWTKTPLPVAKNVGHGSFDNGKYIFHTKTTPKDGWDDREIRITDYKWVNGLPVIAIPKPVVKPQPVVRGRSTPSII